MTIKLIADYVIVESKYVEKRKIVNPCTFSMLLQHQSVVRPSCPHDLCFPKFQRCCPLSMELTPCWHSRLFFTTYFPSSS